jgi:hypothetical protein
MITMSIDPGTEFSAYVIGEGYKPTERAKLLNEHVRCRIQKAICGGSSPGAKLVIERPVCHRHSGAEVSDTAIWTGIFIGTWGPFGTIQYNRQKVRMHIIGKTASDSKIRDALIERFDPLRFESIKFKKGPREGEHKFYYDRGSEWFEGFTDDIWQAYALLVTHLDVSRGKTWAK